MSFFIPYNVPSLKNSKFWTGERLISSQAVREYKLLTLSYWISYKDQFCKLRENYSMPYKISFFFIRKTKHRFDYINACQLPLDLMVEFEWLPDDNADVVMPVFSGYIVDKNNPGVVIDLLS